MLLGLHIKARSTMMLFAESRPHVIWWWKSSSRKFTSNSQFDCLDARNESILTISTRSNKTVVLYNFCTKIVGLLRYSTRIFGVHYFEACTKIKVNEHININSFLCDLKSISDWSVKSTEKSFFFWSEAKIRSVRQLETNWFLKVP